MQRLKLALARSRGYALLADVTARGLTADSLTPLRAVQELAPLLPTEMDAAATDLAAADHYTVFGLNLPPNESVFVNSEAQLGGAAAERVLTMYGTLGYAPPAGSEPDALPAELGCLAFLCGAEADALEDERLETADHVRRLQRDFLRAHLLVWTPPLCEALDRCPHAFYAALAPLLATMFLDHYSDLSPLNTGSERIVAMEPAGADDRLPDDPGVRAIAHYLLAPARCGLWLSRGDLIRVARAAALPASFGDRTQMLNDLFHAAGNFERLPALLNELDRVVAQAESAHTTFEAETPVARPFVAPWLARLDRTRALLRAMREHAAASAQRTAE